MGGGSQTALHLYIYNKVEFCSSQSTILNMFLFESNFAFFFFTGEANDDQPFVPNNEKSTEYDPNLYLYSVSMLTKRAQHFVPVIEPNLCLQYAQQR